MPLESLTSTSTQKSAWTSAWAVALWKLRSQWQQGSRVGASIVATVVLVLTLHLLWLWRKCLLAGFRFTSRTVKGLLGRLYIISGGKLPLAMFLADTNSTMASLPSKPGVSSEPRAAEGEAPWVLRSRVMKHVSFHEEYSIADSHVLGVGLNGRVLLATHRVTQRKVATKCLAAPSPAELKKKRRRKRSGSGGSQDDLAAILPEELGIYLRMSHPNICRLLEAFVEPSGETWLAMEYCQGGELFEQVAGTSKIVRESPPCDTEERVAALVCQMAAAFRYIHGMGVVHRDNKLENWVFASPAQERIKLIDFGFAALVPRKPSDPKLTHVCGTCYYVAPEVLIAKDGRLHPGNGYGTEVDMWALGVIIYMLCSGIAPYTAHNEREILWEIANPDANAMLLKEPFEGKRWEKVSDSCRDLILKCLERDPQKRATAYEAQRHPWLRHGPQEENVDKKKRKHKEEDEPEVREALLGEILLAGSRFLTSRVFAVFCGHIAQRIYLSPALWTELKEDFFSLECPHEQAPEPPAGAVPLETLIPGCLACCNMACARGLCPSSFRSTSDEELCRQLIFSLDLTNDGRLHFNEFIAALIAAGRIQVKEADVNSAFYALDLDRDGVITLEDLVGIGGSVAQRCIPPQETGCLSLPIRGPGAVIRALREELEPVEAKPRHSVSPAGAASTFASESEESKMSRVASDPLQGGSLVAGGGFFSGGVSTGTGTGTDGQLQPTDIARAATAARLRHGERSSTGDLVASSRGRYHCRSQSQDLHEEPPMVAHWKLEDTNRQLSKTVWHMPWKVERRHAFDVGGRMNKSASVPAMASFSAWSSSTGLSSTTTTSTSLGAELSSTTMGSGSRTGRGGGGGGGGGGIVGESSASRDTSREPGSQQEWR